MRIRPDQARAALSRVNPARRRAGRPVGLRDCAILALAAAGMSAEEIAGVRASDITLERGNLHIALQRDDITWYVVLPPDLGGRLFAWLTERRLWAADKPVFTGIRGRGPFSVKHIYDVLYGYGARRSRSRRYRRPSAC